jgi:hypothetical protein
MLVLNHTERRNTIADDLAAPAREPWFVVGG